MLNSVRFVTKSRGKIRVYSWSSSGNVSAIKSPEHALRGTLLLIMLDRRLAERGSLLRVHIGLTFALREASCVYRYLRRFTGLHSIV